MNNAVARTAGLISVAAVGAIVAAPFRARRCARRSAIDFPSPAARRWRRRRSRRSGRSNEGAEPSADRAFVRAASAKASESAFHLAAMIGAGLLVVTGVGGGIGLRTRTRRAVAAAACPGAALSGAPAASVATDPAAA